MAAAIIAARAFARLARNCWAMNYAQLIEVNASSQACRTFRRSVRNRWALRCVDGSDSLWSGLQYPYWLVVILSRRHRSQSSCTKAMSAPGMSWRSSTFASYSDGHSRQGQARDRRRGCDDGKVLSGVSYRSWPRCVVLSSEDSSRRARGLLPCERLWFAGKVVSGSRGLHGRQDLLLHLR